MIFPFDHCMNPMLTFFPPFVSVSLSAHAHPFGIGGWASTYLSVCGLVTLAYTILIRMRVEKNSTTRGYGNASCVMSWACAISVVYGRYGLSGVGVVGATSVAGIPVSIFNLLILYIFQSKCMSTDTHRLVDVCIGHLTMLASSTFIRRRTV